MKNTSDALERAIRSLNSGGVILYPTDTLLGLGSLATSDEAVARLFGLKKRPEGMPVSILFSSTEEVEPYALLSDEARAELRLFLPGPYTFLLDSSPWAQSHLARGLVAADGGIGVRVSSHPVAEALSRRVGPITTTSANIHGQDPVRSVVQARKIFGSKVAVYLPPVPPPAGVPSTIISLRGRRPVLIRG